MFNAANRRTVEQDQVLHWTFQGQSGEQANLELALKIHFVTPTDSGVVIDLSGSAIPEELELGWMGEGDVIAHHGRVIWLKGGNGLTIWHENEAYQLFQVLDAQPEGGVLYFHSWPPREFGGTGEIVYDENQNLEIATVG